MFVHSYVRPFVSPQKVSLISVMMCDSMQNDLIQGQGHEPLKSFHFQKLSLPFTMGAGNWPLN